MDFMPGQSLLVQFLHEGIGIKFFDVPYAGLLPQAEHEQAGTDAGGDTGRIAYALHAGLLVGGTVRAVVVDVIRMFLSVLQATDAATDARLSLIVLTEFLRVGQYGFEELKGDDFLALIVDGYDTGHADILNNAQVGQIFLPESHPEAGATDGGVVLDEAFQLFVVQEVTFARTHFGVGERLVDFKRLRLDPFSVFPVEAFLGDLANIYLGVEICGKGLVMVSGIAIDDVQVLDFVEVMLGGIGRINARHAWVETATEDGRESGLLEALLVGPLPGIFEVGFVLGLIVGRVEIRATALQAGFHDGQILVG